MKIFEIFDSFIGKYDALLLEIHIASPTSMTTNNSSTYNELGPIQPNEVTGMWQWVCPTCKGSGRNQFKNATLMRPGGTHMANNTDKMGGPCLTCNGKGIIDIAPMQDSDGIASFAQLHSKYPKVAEYLIRNVAAGKVGSIQRFRDLQAGKPMPQEYIQMALQQIERDTKDSVKSDDDRAIDAYVARRGEDKRTRQTSRTKSGK